LSFSLFPAAVGTRAVSSTVAFVFVRAGIIVDVEWAIPSESEDKDDMEETEVLFVCPERLGSAVEAGVNEAQSGFVVDGGGGNAGASMSTSISACCICSTSTT
jgi:hypothetical protein